MFALFFRTQNRANSADNFRFVVINLIRDKQNILKSVMSRGVVYDVLWPTIIGPFRPNKICFCLLFRFYVPLSKCFTVLRVPDMSSSSHFMFLLQLEREKYASVRRVNINDKLSRRLGMVKA